MSYLKLLLPLSTLPDPSDDIIELHDFEVYYRTLLTLFFQTEHPDEAYTELAGWLEHEWDWIETGHASSSKDFERYQTILNAYYSRFLTVKQHWYPLKRRLQLPINSVILVHEYQRYDSSTLLLVLEIQ